MPTEDRKCGNCRKHQLAAEQKAAGWTVFQIAKANNYACMICDRHPTADKLRPFAAAMGQPMTDQWEPELDGKVGEGDID